MRSGLVRWLVGGLVWLSAAVTMAEQGSFYALVDQRLELMDEVAAYKWLKGQPIEDAGREAVVIDRAVEDALRYGLTVDSSRRFFTAQIEAAKEIQRHWFQVWRSGDAPRQAPDLEGELRPALLRLGADILAAARGWTTGRGCTTAGGDLSRSAFHQAVQVTGLSDATREALFAAASELSRYDSRLAQILDTGVLRVGTTGDYAPFSHRAHTDEAFTGIDIDLARDLAAALNARAVMVSTSWPELMEDLAAGRYDIAMSGVSRTLERQRHGYLSVPYYIGGKTPIARCADASRFGSLDAIDRPGVRVIVNPGGTNERFMDAHIHRADKVLHEDNRTIFEALAEGGADVMITDRVEVDLQSSRHQALCATLPGTLTYQEKGYLMPQDEPWRAFVDTWLSLALADGTVAAVFREHGVEPSLPGAAQPE